MINGPNSMPFETSGRTGEYMEDTPSPFREHSVTFMLDDLKDLDLIDNYSNRQRY